MPHLSPSLSPPLSLGPSSADRRAASDVLGKFLQLATAGKEGRAPTKRALFTTISGLERDNPTIFRLLDKKCPLVVRQDRQTNTLSADDSVGWLANVDWLHTRIAVMLRLMRNNPLRFIETIDDKDDNTTTTDPEESTTGGTRRFVAYVLGHSLEDWMRAHVCLTFYVRRRLEKNITAFTANKAEHPPSFLGYATTEDLEAIFRQSADQRMMGASVAHEILKAQLGDGDDGGAAHDDADGTGTRSIADWLNGFFGDITDQKFTDEDVEAREGDIGGLLAEAHEQMFDRALPSPDIAEDHRSRQRSGAVVATDPLSREQIDTLLAFLETRSFTRYDGPSMGETREGSARSSNTGRNVLASLGGDIDDSGATDGFGDADKTSALLTSQYHEGRCPDGSRLAELCELLGVPS